MEETESIKFSYTLGEDTYYRALRLVGDFKISARKILVETVVIGVFAVLFLITFFMTWDIFSLIIGVISLAILAMLNITPRLELKRRARGLPSQVAVELTEDTLAAQMGERSREAPLNGTVTIKAVGNGKNPAQQLVAVNLPGGDLLVIPVSSIPEEHRRKALSWLLRHS